MNSCHVVLNIATARRRFTQEIRGDLAKEKRERKKEMAQTN